MATAAVQRREPIGGMTAGYSSGGGRPGSLAESSTASNAATSADAAEQRSSAADWHYGRPASSSSSTVGHKRQRSSRSPSPSRDERGQQHDQQGRRSRAGMSHHEAGQHDEGREGSPSARAHTRDGPSWQSPSRPGSNRAKIPRLAEMGGPSDDWTPPKDVRSGRGPLAAMAQRPASPGRPQSNDTDASPDTVPRPDDALKSASATSRIKAEEDRESNYTWSRERSGRESAGGAGEEARQFGNRGGEPSREARALPPLSSFGGMAAPDAPYAPPSYQQPYPQSGHHSARQRLSPSPRLPGFASLQQSRERGEPVQEQRYHHASQPYGAPPASLMGGAPRAPSMLMRGASPLPSGSPPSVRHPSPSQSQHSSYTPGYPPIHPSLVGLPGSGGGPGSKQQPSFVSKLYSMLEDRSIEDLIQWGPDGTAFSVANPAEFSRLVLPQWFKHSNWQSFVRQLNMYGFHKVNHTYQGNPADEVQIWEFKHASFRRGDIHALADIKRKSSRHKRSDSQGPHPAGIGMVGAMDLEGHHPRSIGSDGSSPRTHPHTSVYGGAASGVVGEAGRHRPMSPPGMHQLPLHRDNRESLDYARTSSLAPPGVQQHGLYDNRSAGRYEAQPGYPQEQRGPPPPPAHQQLPRSLPGHAGPQGAEETVARVDDLSDRVDAIIRHANYLETQLRSVSEQLYQSQQTEAGLVRHVEHLEAQLRSVNERMFQPGKSEPPQAPLTGMPRGAESAGRRSYPGPPHEPDMGRRRSDEMPLARPPPPMPPGHVARPPMHHGPGPPPGELEHPAATGGRYPGRYM